MINKLPEQKERPELRRRLVLRLQILQLRLQSTETSLSTVFLLSSEFKDYDGKVTCHSKLFEKFNTRQPTTHTFL